jgi:hypothetical protein
VSNGTNRPCAISLPSTYSASDRPLFFRASAVDGSEGGSTLEDTVVLARELKARGVDVIDCSSGGISGSATAGTRTRRQPGFQVPYAEAVRRDAEIKTQAVGLITHPRQAEDILQRGRSDRHRPRGAFRSLLAAPRGGCPGHRRGVRELA